MKLNSEPLSPVSRFASLVLAAKYINPIFKKLERSFLEKLNALEKRPPDLAFLSNYVSVLDYHRVKLSEMKITAICSV